MTGMLIRRGSGPWLEPEVAGYAVESELQELLALHPELIPGVSPEARTCREFQSEVGPADIVVVDVTGEVTLVECKLASNPQIRREIVGQMFDYASRLWRMDVGEFARRWLARTSIPLFRDDDQEGIAFKESVALNLAKGYFRIVLAVDVINPALKRMVEYLNAMAGPGTSVVAVEYSRRRQGNVEILMPHVYGQELAEAKSKTIGREVTQWDAEHFRSWLVEHDSGSVDTFDGFLSAASAVGLTFSGSSAVNPAGGLAISDPEGRRLGTVSLFYFNGQGTSVEFSFARMSRMSEGEVPKESVRELFLQQLAQIPGFQEVALELRSSGFKSRKPNVPLAGLPTESILRAVTALRILTSSQPIPRKARTFTEKPPR